MAKMFLYTIDEKVKKAVEKTAKENLVPQCKVVEAILAQKLNVKIKTSVDVKKLKS